MSWWDRQKRTSSAAGWIEEHQALHGADRRAVALSWRDGNELDYSFPLQRLLGGLARPHVMLDMACHGTEKEKWEFGPLMLFPDGVPNAYKYTADIIDHLSQV